MLAGCGAPLPVFAPAGPDKPTNALELTAGAGIRVEPPTGLPGDIGRMLAEEVALALQDRGIPAAVGVGNQRARLLEGEGSLSRSNDGRVLDLIWTMREPDGRLTLQTENAWAIPLMQWDTGLETVLVDLGQASAKPFADSLMGPPDAGPRVVYLGTVEGAPDEGSKALMGALRTGLRTKSVPIADTLAPATAFISATLEKIPVDATRERVRINWIVSIPQNASQAGTELGRLSQETLVEPGVLEADWTQSAFFITQGVLPDLLKLLAQSRGRAVYTDTGG